MSPRKHSRSRAGFTLIELMIALIAGSFVVSGAYYLSDVSARLFNEQMRRSETQMTLRTAGEQLRRDIGRAGYLAVRDTAELWGCNAVQGGTGISPTRQRGVRVERAANGPVSLYLTGNFTTSDQYPITIESTANRLVLAITREGYRRSFTHPATGAFLPARFLSAFAPDPTAPNVAQGRMVSIQDLSTGRIYLRNIVAVDPNATGPSISIEPDLPTGGGCIPSLTTLVVAPISTVRYRLEDPTLEAELRRSAGTSALTGGQTVLGARRFALVRREINMTDQTADPVTINGTARIVLDFVSNAAGFNSFRVEGLFDQNTFIGGAAQVPNLVYTATPETLAAGGLALRSLLVELLAESAESTRGIPENYRSSRIQAGRRVLRMEVSMPNMARNPGTI